MSHLGAHQQERALQPDAHVWPLHFRDELADLPRGPLLPRRAFELVVQAPISREAVDDLGRTLPCVAWPIRVN